jgi:hypothetical protein
MRVHIPVVVNSISLIALVPLSATAQDESSGIAARVARLEAQVAALEVALGRAQEVLKFVRVESDSINGLAGPHWIVEGANVHVRSGSGSTDDGCGTNSDCPGLAGLGNLVVGYNEPSLSNDTRRTGSHTLIVGPYHGYTSYGGFVAGFGNTVSGISTSISGGAANSATGIGSSVCGGLVNVASGVYSSVSGGESNTAVGSRSSVSGGWGSSAEGLGSSVSGGGGNIAEGDWSSVGGGVGNLAIGPGSSVSGGDSNQAEGFSSSVSGGRGNQASGANSSIGGGIGNTAEGFGSSVSGGGSNTAEGRWSSVSGGSHNEARGVTSSVSGGRERTAPADDNWSAGSLLEPN